MKFNKLVVSLILMSLLLTVMACGGATTPQPETTAKSVEPAATTVVSETKAESNSGDKPIIKLAENNWSASTLNVTIAKILLEEQMGYKVELVSLDENAQWSAIAKGDLHASLEIWPSGHVKDTKQYIEEQKSIENGGLLGPIGKIGWYVPTYMVEQHPELATWEGFKDPKLASLFKTAETGDKGQFLAGDPSFVQYDADIIKNLGLNLQVVHAGSSEAELAALQAAYSRKDPILFYFWTPHSVHAQYDLAEVKLPSYTPDCYAKSESGSVACDYPTDDLFKIFWPGLKEAAPQVYQFLKAMHYTTQDQITMIAAVELDKKTPEEAARAWLDANKETWQKWLPK